MNIWSNFSSNLDYFLFRSLLWLPGVPGIAPGCRWQQFCAYRWSKRPHGDQIQQKNVFILVGAPSRPKTYWPWTQVGGSKIKNTSKNPPKSMQKYTQILIMFYIILKNFQGGRDIISYLHIGSKWDQHGVKTVSKWSRNRVEICSSWVWHHITFPYFDFY